MKKAFCFMAAVLFVVFAVGCSSVTIKKVAKGDTTTEGLRFYRPAPYLVVTKDTAKDTSLTYKIIYLPDKSEEYTIQTNAGIGTVENTYTLTDGWELTNYTDKRDTKITEAVTGAAGMVTALATLKSVHEDDKTLQAITPGIYALEFDENGMIKGIKQVIKF
jgi:hypothetical protein